MPTAPTDPTGVDLPEKNRYTYADFQQLPEGAPYELISGHLVMSPSPTPYHQLIQSNLFYELSRSAREQAGGRVLSAPLDVRFSDTEVLHPDLVYVGQNRLDIIGEQDIDGAPDLIGEILCPSTAHKDLTTKKRLYEVHGVAEYWTVDPNQQAVEVFQNTDDGFAQHVRVVEEGTASSALLADFSIDLADLF